jgi:LuxR family maltose regulon positive regulatory protein
VNYQWDDVAAAARHVEQATAAAVTSGDRQVEIAAAAIQALVLATQGPRGADDGLRRLRAALGNLDDHRISLRIEGLAVGTELRVLAARGDVEAAWSSSRGQADALLRTRLLLAQRHPESALRELESAPPEPAFDSTAAATERCVLESVARAELHDRAAAAETLERGLEIAGPNTHRRPFIDGGPLVRELLVQQIRNGTAHRSLVAELIAAFDRRAPKVALTRAELLEPLSPREEAVLRYLPTLMSNTEIAGELFVSGNTVKTHLKSIYRKLGVARRRDAVERARALEIL